ncbi:type III secretion system outer membrane ring subunit SctC [Pseudothauera rhizosphaerae]|uniref:Type 3 secretion system secretin n=1 Tax=Pseudothauera rhizosphaerae TaxID=2565932 RepID=A0A4V3W9Z6_9RHOO|nr:type III secretion system outer membrane ring subunit SctC [Pseudothauera rhizosphaerae]THF57259.1 EscC/YscC/HrcC family type III secretion system outer membrane ring protein [Pseudothauera rhizosphaerae]
MRRCTPFLRGLAAILVLSAAGLAAAAPAPWPEVPFQYFARQFPLPRVLGDFAGAFGLKLELSPLVGGQLNGNYSAATPTQFLDTLASSYGLTWYYHGGVLHVAKASESISRTLRVGASDVGALKAALNNLGIFDARYGWGEFADRGVVILSGPPAYVDLVMGTVAELGSGPSGGREIRVFPLKHARAEDRSFSYRDQQVTTPGVASILRGLVADQETAGGTSSLTTTPAGGTAPSALGADAPAAAERPPVRAAANARRAVIEADQRLNAVIVHDAPEHMAAYESLIRQLDVPTPLIEIEAMIMDINTDRLDSLGVAWAGRTGDFTFGFGDTSPDPGTSTVTIGAGDNINKTTILSNTTSFFVAQVNALASDGDARILARPSVLTVDNLVAVLDLSETFYVRVTGERVAELVPISTGTLLKVTPRLIEENGLRMVQLVVDIEDGKIQPGRQVDTLPTVLQSNISTQAVVRENDSLLIGGYFLDSETSSEDRVPLLGDVPVLGLLFRNSQAERQRRERLFMIRPRIIDNPSVSAARTPPAAVPLAAAVPGAAAAVVPAQPSVAAGVEPEATPKAAAEQPPAPVREVAWPKELEFVSN